MNHIVMYMRRFTHLALLVASPMLALSTLAACNGSGPPTPVETPPLEGAAIGGPFELLNPAGETVRWSDFDGQYRMVYFGYTWCPDACPFDLSRMMLGYRQFAETDPDRAAQIQPIFITIDPVRDTPEKVGEYVSNFGPNLIGLTGSPEQITETATNFSVYFERGADDPNIGYMMEHSKLGYLMGPSGEPIALLPVDKSAEGVTAELDRWVN